MCGELQLFVFKPKSCVGYLCEEKQFLVHYTKTCVYLDVFDTMMPFDYHGKQRGPLPINLVEQVLIKGVMISFLNQLVITE